MSVAGIALSTYEPGALRKVPAHLDRRPDRSFDLDSRLGERAVEWVRDRYGQDGGTELSAISHKIPMRIYSRLSLDELCKVRFSTTFMMDGSVEEAFKAEPRLTIYHKITNCMWRWGYGRPGWNEVVDVYEGIRRFDLGHPDFEMRLDHSTSCNECGYSEHSRTFLDGVFGYLVHHRGEHVMTLGFSLMSGRRLLIQQVQLRNRRGNRWLFKLPRNYLEHVIERFGESFPRHRLFVVDGSEVIGRGLASYRDALDRSRKRRAEMRTALSKCTPEDEPHYRLRMEDYGEDARRLRECISHAEGEVARIDAFYSGTGRYLRGRTLTINRLKHYEISAESREEAHREPRR